KMVNKKAISPLLVTVLLVGFTIVLSAGIMTWTKTTTQSQMDIAKEWSEADWYRFSARYHASCDDAINYSVSCEGAGSSCYVLLVENKESSSVDYVIETSGNKGIEICGPFSVEPFASELVQVTYNNISVGMPTSDECQGCWLEAEIVPVNS
ncbi:hypothetical protein HOD61_03040, partial [archaeon]|nr:hypothetical protein [archaeon]